MNFKCGWGADADASEILNDPPYKKSGIRNPAFKPLFYQNVEDRFSTLKSAHFGSRWCELDYLIQIERKDEIRQLIGFTAEDIL